jgi:hypothetical protein
MAEPCCIGCMERKVNIKDADEFFKELVGEI